MTPDKHTSKQEMYCHYIGQTQTIPLSYKRDRLCDIRVGDLKFFPQGPNKFFVRLKHDKQISD